MVSEITETIFVFRKNSEIDCFKPLEMSFFIFCHKDIILYKKGKNIHIKRKR